MEVAFYPSVTLVGVLLSITIDLNVYVVSDVCEFQLTTNYVQEWLECLSTENSIWCRDATSRILGQNKLIKPVQTGVVVTHIA